jgi:hypothetical protein
VTANSSDRKSIRALEKAAKLADTLRADVIRQIMSTSTGRLWMWDQLAECYIYRQSFTSDPLATAFNEGRRSIGLALMADILRVCPDQYITAQREANDRSTLIEQRSSSLGDGGDSGPVDNPSDGSPPSGTSSPETGRSEDWGSGIIGVEAEVLPNGYTRPYRHLNHN